jgi:TatD DNase family protein
VNLTDTHCHLYFDQYREDLPQVLSRAQENGVDRILVPGIDLQSSLVSLQLAERYPCLYAAVGVHPNSARTWTADTAAELSDLLSHPKVVAIGEIGLDYYREGAPRPTQVEILKIQLDLARTNGLPVILHVRNKSEQDRACITDLLDLLEEWMTQVDPFPLNLKNRPGVIHAFSGNKAESQRALEAGFCLGITGAVTFKNASTLREVVKAVPLSSLLIETDGPFITPDPFRGKRNEPAYVRYIVDKISYANGVPQQEVAQQTTTNAACLFQWE